MEPDQLPSNLSFIFAKNTIHLMEGELPKLKLERGITMFKKILIFAGGVLAGMYVTANEVYKCVTNAVISNYEAKEEAEKKAEVVEEKPKKPSRKKKPAEVPDSEEEAP